MLFVVTIGWWPPRCAVAFANVGYLSANGIAGQFDRVLAGLPGFDALDQFALVPFGDAIGGKQHIDAGQFHAVKVIAGFVGPAARETRDVIAEDRFEVAAVFGSLDHTGEVVAATGAGPGNRIVDEPANDAVTVLLGPLFDVGHLVRNGTVLQIGGTSGIACGPNESRMTFSHDCPFDNKGW